MCLLVQLKRFQQMMLVTAATKGRVNLIALLLSSNLHVQASDTAGKHLRKWLNHYNFVHLLLDSFNKSTGLDSELHFFLFIHQNHQHTLVL